MRILTVSQALSYLRELIESDLVLGDVWVAGEVSGPRTQPSGHTYFTLKDESAQLRSVLFRSALLRQRRLADYLTQGSQVIGHGRLTVYEARGEPPGGGRFLPPAGGPGPRPGAAALRRAPRRAAGRRRLRPAGGRRPAPGPVRAAAPAA